MKKSHLLFLLGIFLIIVSIGYFFSIEKVTHKILIEKKVEKMTEIEIKKVEKIDSLGGKIATTPEEFADKIPKGGSVSFSLEDSHSTILHKYRALNEDGSEAVKYEKKYSCPGTIPSIENHSNNEISCSVRIPDWKVQCLFYLGLIGFIVVFWGYVCSSLK